MSWLVAAPIIGGALAGVGSYLAGQAQSDASKSNAKATERANQANIAYQKEFAQSGIQWRVADAQKQDYTL